MQYCADCAFWNVFCIVGLETFKRSYKVNILELQVLQSRCQIWLSILVIQFKFYPKEIQYACVLDRTGVICNKTAIQSKESKVLTKTMDFKTEFRHLLLKNACTTNLSSVLPALQLHLHSDYCTAILKNKIKQ